uniref:Uncharacterized protein n=1 Tax=Coccidioides posadasii RMSCC 3488 TaxID=454284 RepID=A0A0J6FR34_COCPO|nr:hypothetical protein CPAG_07791 [Coccidioides posadasii RMSCC 3488]
MISPETHTSSESGTTDESWESISKTEKGTHCVVVKAANRMTISVRDNHMSPLQHGHARLRRPGSPYGSLSRDSQARNAQQQLSLRQLRRGCCIGFEGRAFCLDQITRTSTELRRSYCRYPSTREKNDTFVPLESLVPVLDAVEEPQGLKGRP